MNSEPLYESAKRVATRSRMVAIMRDLARIFGCNIVEVHKIARRDLSHHELEQPMSEPAP
jgi:hypothetical protein